MKNPCNAEEPSVSPFYLTKDRYEIYVLLANDCVLDGFERLPHDGIAIYFRFQDKSYCQYILDLRSQRRLQVDPQKLRSAMREAHAFIKSFQE